MFFFLKKLRILLIDLLMFVFKGHFSCVISTSEILRISYSCGDMIVKGCELVDMPFRSQILGQRRSHN